MVNGGKRPCGYMSAPILQECIYNKTNAKKLKYAPHHFFSERVVSVWNNLENNVINFSNIKCFKRSLLCCNLSRYTHF